VSALGRDAVVIQPANEYREVYSLHTKEAVLRNPRKRSQVVAYVRALIAACNQAAKNPRKAQEFLSTIHGRTPTDIAAAWNYNFVCQPTAGITDLLIEEERWLATQEARPPRTRDEIARLVDTSVFDEVRGLSPKRR
jgi:NitT/TauT family transport system substrate-binding protein